MRITCQNCRAQYDIDSSELPAEGCEVECLGCGKVWYQWPDHERTLRLLGSRDTRKKDFLDDSTEPLDLELPVDTADTVEGKSYLELPAPADGAMTSREVKRILEEELVESTKLEKIARKSEERQQVLESPDATRNSKWPKETGFPHQSNMSIGPTIRRSGPQGSGTASVRRRNGEGSRGDLFRYGILPLFLLAVFLGLVHFSLPIAGQLFDEVRPYAKAYESVAEKVASFAASIFTD